MAVNRRGKSWTVRVWRKGEAIWVGSFSDAEYGGKDEAHLAAQQALIDAKQSTVGTRYETCESFASRWIADYNATTKNGSPRWGKKTCRDSQYSLKTFIAAFGSKPLRSLTTPEARRWAATQPLIYVQRARTMMNDAVRDGLCDRNPFSALRLEGSRGRRDIEVLTEPEIERLCDVAIEVWPEYGLTFAAMIATAAYTGIRPGELFALTRSDVRVDACELDVHRSYNGLEIKAPKNGRPRLGIILPPQAGARIAAMPRKLAADYLFEPPTGGLFARTTLYHYWQPVRVRFGRLRLAFYELRHAAATLLLERGVSVEDCAWQLGHVDGGRLVATLYGHPSDEGRRERIKRVFGQNVQPLRQADRKAADG